MNDILNVAAYKFVALDELPALRARLRERAEELELRGTILLSPEGLNLFIAGAESAVERLLDELISDPRLGELNIKRSWSREQPFNRMLVKIKKEIIAFGDFGIDPVNRPAPRVSAKELKAWLDAGREVVLLDTRNDYEVKLGTFSGARDFNIRHFRDFTSAAREQAADLADKTVVTFCTGGIRCEKAAPFLIENGYKHVYQLDGGILAYFEQCGGAHYAGECFVFDRRVALDPNLEETGTVQCFNCLSPLALEEQQSPAYVPDVSCPYCA